MSDLDPVDCNSSYYFHCSMIAVPGVATVNLLTQSIGTDGLTWSSTVQCTQASRDPRDNVASLFWPKLMEVRGLLERLDPADLQSATSYIKASLCDGEDEASPELKQALMETMTEEKKKVWLGIRARVENIVHSLLRVEKFQTSLPKIINPKPEVREDLPETPRATSVPSQGARVRPNAPERQVSRSVPVQPRATQNNRR